MAIGSRNVSPTPVSHLDGSPLIATVRGPIDSSALGLTLMHEHLFVAPLDGVAAHPSRWGTDGENVTRAVALLQRAYERGVRTIVEMSVEGLGRRWPLVEEVARQVDINIVLATGVYFYRDIPIQYAFDGPGTPFGGKEYLDGLLLGDIRDGCHGSGVRAQVLKCVVDQYGMTGDVMRVTRAVAKVHRQTGACVMTHTDAGSGSGLDQARALIDLGVAPRRIVVGHCDDSSDIGYLRSLLGMGVTIGFDRFGFEASRRDDDRIATLVELVREGHQEHIVLSQDYSAKNCLIPARVQDEVCPDWGYTRVVDYVLPRLETEGIAPDALIDLTVNNPRRLLELGAPVAEESV